MPDPTVLQWTLVAAAVLVGGLLTGASGFGFALATTPVLIWLLDPITLVVANLCLSVPLRLPIVAADVRHLNRAIAGPLIVGGLLGLPLGVALLELLSRENAKLMLSLTVVVAGLSYLASPEWIAPVRRGRVVWGALVGLASGALTTSSSLSGPPVVLWLANQQLDKRRFRVTMSVTGLVLNVVGLLLLLTMGRAGPSLLILPLILLPVAAGGAMIGHRVLRQLTDRGLARVAACIVVLSGAIGIVVLLR